MPRIIKMPFKKVLNETTPWIYSLPENRKGDVQAHIFIAALEPVKLVAVGEIADNEIMLPLWQGTQLDQTYAIPAEVDYLQVEGDRLETVTIGYFVELQGMRENRNVDPVPVRQIIPVDDNSIDARIRRQVEALAAQHGIGVKPKGQRYEYDEEDEEFGPGYSYDEDADEALTAQAIANVRDFHRRHGRMPTADDFAGNGTGRSNDPTEGPGHGDGQPGKAGGQSSAGDNNKEPSAKSAAKSGNRDHNPD